MSLLDGIEPATIARTLAKTRGAPPLPRRADREAWRRLGRQAIATEVRGYAEEALTTPLPALLATDYLVYHRTGDRRHFEVPLDARRDRLVRLTLAECLEGEGRFLEAILDTAWATLDEATWIVPAHGFGFVDGLPPPTADDIDLWSAMACLLMAEVDHLLDDALHPALRRRVRSEVARRGTDLLLARDDLPWMSAKTSPRVSPNWAPVCAGLTAGAAVYLESDVDRLAGVVAKTLHEMAAYLRGFPADGGCSEGLGYWEKGLFALTAFAELLAARTEGRLDLMATPELQEIARFPLRVQLGPQRYPVFSDSSSSRVVQPALLHQLAATLEIPELAGLDQTPETERRLTRRYPAEQIRDFVWWERAAPSSQRPAAVDWLPDTQWFVARAEPGDPDALVLAAKAGHNDEPHNHNDVGSFVIQVGGRPIVAELGAGIYERDSFRPETRYAMLMNGSQGHSVPVVNGHYQATGREHAARDVVQEASGLAMDLALAYPAAAGVEQLRRELWLDRETRSVVVTDRARLLEPGVLCSVVISFDAAQESGPGRLRLGNDLELRFDPISLKVKIERLTGIRLRDSDDASVTRIGFTPRSTSTEPSVRLRFVPTDDALSQRSSRA